MSSTTDWPNRGPTTIGVTIFITILSTLIAIWRLVVRFKLNPKMGWSDYWMMIAVPLALVGHTLAILGAQAGEGRLDADPFLTPDQVALAKKYQFFMRCFNIYAMFFAKLSICAYLLALNFSKTYRITICISLVVIVALLGIFPFVGHWWQCKPLKIRWDKRVHGNCWGGNQFKFWSNYLQTSTNVVTDVLFAAAPILYLRRVKLSKYTRIGVQGVFLCSVLGTGITVGKLIEFRRSYGNKNELYIASTSTILNVCENSMAIMVGCLPPLRRTFDDLLKKILPESLLSRIGASGQRSEAHALPTYFSSNKTKTRNAMDDGLADDDSDLRILPDEELVEDSHGRIVKTTKVEITTNDSTEFGTNGQNPLRRGR